MFFSMHFFTYMCHFANFATIKCEVLFQCACHIVVLHMCTVYKAILIAIAPRTPRMMVFDVIVSNYVFMLQVCRQTKFDSCMGP